MTTRSKSVATGNRTRAARRTFVKLYGENTAKVIRLLATGVDSYTVAELTGLPRPSVSTYRANLTRGQYWPFVAVRNGKTIGDCRF